MSFLAVGRTDRHDEANSCFPQFYEDRKRKASVEDCPVFRWLQLIGLENTEAMLLSVK